MGYWAQCGIGKITLYITILYDVNQAFELQVIGGAKGVNRTGVTLSIDQFVDAKNTTHKFLSCQDASSSCEDIIPPKSLTTYTWRTMAINWSWNNVELINSTLQIKSVSTEATIVVPSDKAYPVMPVAFENTRQLFTVKTDNSYSYVTKFTLSKTSCFIDNTTSTLKLLDSDKANAKVLVDFQCNTNSEQTFNGAGFLEYKRKETAFGKDTVSGELTVTSKKNSATRSAFSWAAALLVAYKIMLKY